MEQSVFERPREKIQAKGAAYLSTTELLQVIIGSGNAKVSSARLAKRVTDVLMNGRPTIESLLTIDGIGLAKASQIIASVELGVRMNEVKGQRMKSEVNDDLTQKTLKAIAKATKSTLIVYLYDGADRELVVSEYNTTPSKIAIRKLCADALLANARKVSVVVGQKKRELTLSTNELSLIKQLNTSLAMLNIDLSNVYIADEKRVEKWKI